MSIEEDRLRLIARRAREDWFDLDRFIEDMLAALPPEKRTDAAVADIREVAKTARRIAEVARERNGDASAFASLGAAPTLSLGVDAPSELKDQ